MKERPILFKGEMVKATLDGRKTQTRRILENQPEPSIHVEGHFTWRSKRCLYDTLNTAWNPISKAFQDAIRCGHCRFGVPGDRLWVKETFAPTGVHKTPWTYRADWKPEEDTHERDFQWKPSIFMTRKASRINLEVVSVRVERLNSINDEDAIAEGIDSVDSAGGKLWRDYLIPDPFESFTSPKRSYKSLWEKINGKGSWKKNPFVWVIKFKKV